MKDLLACTKRLDIEVDSMLPLLITDQWSAANEKMTAIVPVLNEFIEKLISQIEQFPEFQVSVLQEILQKINYVMQAGDSIQFADILAYDLGSVLQMVYAGCGQMEE